MRLSNGGDDIAFVAAALASVGAAIGLDALEADDLLTAVLEPCKNVAAHAYDGTEGPLELGLAVQPGIVAALVRDHGIGIRPLVGERSLPHTGIGMPIVHMLARRVSYLNLPDGGTEITLELELGRAAAPAATAACPELAETGRAAFALGPGSFAAQLLPSLVAAAAQLCGRPDAGPRELAAALGRCAGSDGVAVCVEPLPDGLLLVVNGVDASLLAEQVAATDPVARRCRVSRRGARAAELIVREPAEF